MRKLPSIRRIPNDLWMEIAPILGKENEPGTKGRRPPAPFRMVLDGILYVLRTGCHWKKMLPREYGSGSTCHRRFQQWVREKRSIRKDMDQALENI
jgi:transposase